MSNKQTDVTQKFQLGHIGATPGAVANLQEMDILWAIKLHSIGRWGNVPEEDAKANDDALIYGGRILSAYQSAGVKFWIITEADRSSTLVLLPSEY